MLFLFLACTDDPTPSACNGLDLDEDGQCDRERADWSANAQIPEGGDRGNIYGLSSEDLETIRVEGLQQAAIWPVDVSGMLLPSDSFLRLFEDNTADSGREAFQSFARGALGFGTISEMYNWVGLPHYPADNSVPIPDGLSPGDAMGAGIVQTDQGHALTFSCYACHATEMFGHTVVGMSNRRTRANEFFHLASQFFPLLDDDLYQTLSDASTADVEMLLYTQQNLPAVGTKVPLAAGLDTSLAQVGLSLARREDDAYAAYSEAREANPLPSALDTEPADSKPAVWWTLKYKTRWLADGSIVSGNPILTNFLWNEIGRGTDLHLLEAWMQENGRAIDALTVAVFDTPAPTWDQIFPQYPLDRAAAERGQAHFETLCASCHGQYEKDWATGTATTAVFYPTQTQVMNVGTDAYRAQGMEAFADRLNDLAISQWMQTTVAVQDGYVPPPLVAIWARYPYLHNGSIPSLCALLNPTERPDTFYLGPTDNAATDFDADCVGYPVGAAIPAAWMDDPRLLVDTRVAGLSHAGHEAWLLDDQGDPVLSNTERADLIAYLKTL